MTFELIKELYEANFPKQDFHVIYPNSKYPTREGQRNAPSFAELVEACNVNFEWFGRTLSGKWRVDAEDMSFTGDTKDEVVARLWLALNKK